MAKITIQQAQAKIRAMAESMQKGDYTSDISNIMEDSIYRNLQAGGRPKWKKRSKAYLDHLMATIGRITPPLRLTGEKDSVEQHSAKHGWRRTARQWKLSIRTTDYGAIHHKGTGLPKRQTVKPLQSEVEGMKESIIDRVMTAYKEG